MFLTVSSSKAVPCPPCPVPPSSIRKAIPLVTNARRVFLVVLLSRRIEYPTREFKVPTAPGKSPNSLETPEQVVSDSGNVRAKFRTLSKRYS